MTVIAWVEVQASVLVPGCHTTESNVQQFRAVHSDPSVPTVTSGVPDTMRQAGKPTEAHTHVQQSGRQRLAGNIVDRTQANPVPGKLELGGGGGVILARCHSKEDCVVLVTSRSMPAVTAKSQSRFDL